MGQAGLWSPPVSPDRWFDSDALARSRSYHRPLTAAAAVRSVGHVVGLGAVWIGASATLGQHEADRTASLVVSGAAVGAAIWLPHALVATWMEFRHEVRFGASALPASRFAAVTLTSGLGTMGFGAVAAAGIGALISAGEWWPVVVAVLALAIGFATGPVVTMLTHRSEPLDAKSESEFDTIAASGGIRGVGWGRLTSSFEAGLNAVTLDVFGRRTILVSPQLLEADPDVRDFVIAHEVAHIQRRHHRRARAIGAVGTCVEVSGLWLVHTAAAGQGFSGVSDARVWPLGVLAVGALSLPASIVEAWASRLHERQADLDAIANLGSPGASVLRQLHQHSRSNLDPDLVTRLLGGHPPPAERLMTADRLAAAL